MEKCITPTLRRLIILLLLSTPLGWSQAKQKRPLIIDMHLHAVAADATGPPPTAMCVPMVAHLPDGDPNKPWQEKMAAWLKNPPCTDPVWSPRTDRELMEQTIAIMERHNVIGALSGTPERVREWKKAAPNRFIP